MSRSEMSTVDQGNSSPRTARNSEQPVRFSGNSETGPAAVSGGLAALLIRRKSLLASRAPLETTDTSSNSRLMSNHETTAVTGVDGVPAFPGRTSPLQSQTTPSQSTDGHVPIRSSPAGEVSAATKEDTLVCSRYLPPEDEPHGVDDGIISVASNEDCHVQEPEQVMSGVQLREHSQGSPKEVPAPEMRTTGPTVTSTTAGCSCSDATFPSLKEKRLEDWPLIPLRKECLNLGISGMSKEKDKIKMAELIRRARQHAACRKERLLSTDVGASSQGSPAGYDTFPDGVVNLVRNLLSLGVTSDRSSGSTVKFEGRSYVFGDVLAYMEERDAADARAAAIGSSDALAKNRKTKNCIARLLLLIIDDQFRDRFLQSQSRATRAELDSGALGTRHPVWADLRDAFVDPDREIPDGFADDPILGDINPGIVGQPHMTTGELVDIFNATKERWNETKAKYRLCGNQCTFWEFCQGDRDVYMFDAVANKFPAIHKFCDGLMPEGVRREDDGTSNGLKSHRANGTLQSDAERRSAAKRAAQDDLRSVTKKDKKSEEMEKRIDHVLNKTLSRVSSLFGKEGKEDVKNDDEQERAKWDAEVSKLQSESVKLDLLKKSFRAEMELRRAYIEQYEELEKKIVAQRGRPDGGNPVFIALVEAELADIVTALGKRSF